MKIGMILFLVTLALGLSIEANAEQPEATSLFGDCDEAVATLNSTDPERLEAAYDEIDPSLRADVLLSIFQIYDSRCGFQRYTEVSCDVLNHGYRITVEAINRYDAATNRSNLDESIRRLRRETHRNTIRDLNRAISQKHNCEMYGMNDRASPSGSSQVRRRTRRSNRTR